MLANATPPSRRVLANIPPVRPASPASAPALAPIRAGPLPDAAALRRQVTRSLVGQRLRINGIIFGLYYVASRSAHYASATAYLIQRLPALDSPLHWLEFATLLLLGYNILESLHKLNALSTILPPPLPPQSTPLRPKQSLQNRSSPKTRPSPSPTATRSLAKAESPLNSVSPLRLSSPSLRNSTTPGVAITTPNRRRSLLSTSTSTPLPSSVTPIKQDNESPKQPILTAFMVRHSPVASTFHRSISDRQSIDRLFEPRESM